MIKVKLVNLFRRAGMGFPLKSPQREHICDMQINSGMALHEAQVPLDVFLKHSKAIAQMAQNVGCGVYVADVTLDIPAAVQEFWAGYNLAMDGQLIPDDASKAAIAGHIVGMEQGHEIKEPALPFVEPTATIPDMPMQPEVQDANQPVDFQRDSSLTTVDTDAIGIGDGVADVVADADTEKAALEYLPPDEELRDMGYRDLRTLAKPFNVYKLGMTTEQLLAALIALRTPAA